MQHREERPRCFTVEFHHNISTQASRQKGEAKHRSRSAFAVIGVNYNPTFVVRDNSRNGYRVVFRDKLILGQHSVEFKAGCDDLAIYSHRRISTLNFAKLVLANRVVIGVQHGIERRCCASNVNGYSEQEVITSVDGTEANHLAGGTVIVSMNHEPTRFRDGCPFNKHSSINRHLPSHFDSWYQPIILSVDNTHHCKQSAQYCHSH